MVASAVLAGDPQVGNPGFEGPLGVVPEQWRWFHTGGPAGGFAVTEAPGDAVQGTNVAHLGRTDPSGDSALDNDTPSLRFSVLAGHVYLLDYAVRGAPGMSDHDTALRWHAAPGDGNAISITSFNVPDPQSAWERFGFTDLAPAVSTGDPADATHASIRFSINGTGDLQLDDVIIMDVTYNRNRVLNGGFENSAGRPVNWVVVDDPGTGVPSNALVLLDNPGFAFEGTNSVVLSRQNLTDDFFLQSFPIAVRGGEAVELRLALFLAGPFSGTFVRATLTEYSGGAFLQEQSAQAAPAGPSQYESFTLPFTLQPSSDSVTVSLRVVDGGGNPAVGDYIIDAISIVVPADDCNGNNWADEDDIAAGTSQDCNSNAIPDECDVVAGVSTDCQPNGVPDECEVDCNSNGLPDDCDIAAGISADCQPNSVPDDCEADCDTDGLPDDCELDCDQNGTPDDCEAVPDCNTNGRSDVCDVGWGLSPDVNTNGIPDECEPDCNSNALPDDYDIVVGNSADCNVNGAPDDCDIAAGTSQDLFDAFGFNPSGDGVADECCLQAPGADQDADGDVDLFDYSLMQQCAGVVAGSATGGAAWNMLRCGCVDLNADGLVDDTDVDGFVTQFTGPQ